MPDYSQGKVYKLVCNVTGLVYVGSTVSPLYKRKCQHRRDYKRYKDGKYNYITSFKIVEGGNCDIVLLEDVSCESKEQLHRVERKWIEALDCVNRCVPTRTKQEYDKIYMEAHKDEKREYDKIYREVHKDEKREYNKIYREAHKDEIAKKKKSMEACPCGTDHCRAAKAQHLRSLKHRQWEEQQKTLKQYLVSG